MQRFLFWLGTILHSLYCSAPLNFIRTRDEKAPIDINRGFVEILTFTAELACPAGALALRRNGLVLLELEAFASFVDDYLDGFTGLDLSRENCLGEGIFEILFNGAS